MYHALRFYTEGVDLAEVHELIQYVAEGTIGERRHQDHRFSFTVQYSNKDHPEVDTFYLSEFIVYAVDPESGEDVAVLYATLGDYQQPVPAFVPEWPPSIWNFPVTLVVSDAVEVTVDCPAGFVTYDDLTREVGKACEEIGGLFRMLNITIPAAGWVLAEEANDDYHFICDVADTEVRAEHIPSGAVTIGSFQTASRAGLVGGCETFDGFVRFYAKRIPKQDINACIHLFRKGRMADTEDSGGSGGTDGPTVDNTPDGFTVSEPEEVEQMLDGIFERSVPNV